MATAMAEARKAMPRMTAMTVEPDMSEMKKNRFAGAPSV